MVTGRYYQPYSGVSDRNPFCALASDGRFSGSWVDGVESMYDKAPTLSGPLLRLGLDG
jgi:hypothetical protein